MPRGFPDAAPLPPGFTRELLLHETPDTVIAQAYGVRVPGYSIVQTRSERTSLADLDSGAASDLLACLTLAESLVREILAPERIFLLRFGEENPWIHFHVVPRTARIERAYRSEADDERPYSGARIVDWLWRRHESLGHTGEEIASFVRRARTLASRHGRGTPR